MMEQHRFPRRSASHGTLRSSYASHGNFVPGPSPLRPLHKPLRSVNENSVLLHSPGALESMLKTTTETGDIGIFTIKPIPPSPLGPRGAVSEAGHPPPRPHRSIDNMYRQNPAVRPSSHRGVPSEIFSAYGSDSVRSGTSTLSPILMDDSGQRSYSMTTCGSRHLSHHRSTNTLQSQASGGSNLQRPRSPFPYPTRLKRPGVRPASPAITENGQIDYSRMVEINRVSYVGTHFPPHTRLHGANRERQRTIHGHFKQPCSPMFRKPPPLGLRVDVNRSTASLAPPGPPPNFHGPPRPTSVRTYSPASITPWNPPFHERFDSSSTRTSSLTSVTNAYRRMPLVLRPAQSFVPEPPPRYYDYTEDFENKPPRLAPLTQELVPLHAQARYPQPIMLRGDEDHLDPRHLAAVFGEGDSAFFDCESQVLDEQDSLPVLNAFSNRSQCQVDTLGEPMAHCGPGSASSHDSTIDPDGSEFSSRKTRTSDIDLLPSQIRRDSIDTFNPSLDLESRDVPASYNYVRYHANATPKTNTRSPGQQVQVLGGRALTIRSERGVILREDTNCETPGWESPDSSQSHIENGSDSSRSPNQHGKLPVSNDLTRQELDENPAAAEEAISQHTGLSTSCDESPIPDTDPNLHRAETPENLPVLVITTRSGDEVDEDSEQELRDSKADDKTPQFRCHKRNHAVLRISTTNLPRDDNEGHPHITPTCSTAPLMSPKPISPARQLKVKNSIPQLMKALPPLPGILGYDLPATTTDVPEEDEFAEILVPFAFPEPAESFQPDQRSTVDPPPIACGAAPNLQNEGPKFRLRIKTNDCSETACLDENVKAQSGTETGDENDEKNARNRNRMRNKLKVRSPRRSRLSSSHCSTIRRNPDVETSQIITDLMQQKPKDLFSIPSKSEVMLLRKRRRPIYQLAQPQAHSGSNSSNLHSRDKSVRSLSYRLASNASTDNNETPALDQDALISSIPARGLIKRLSNLRALLSSSTMSTNAGFDEENCLRMRQSLVAESTQSRIGQRIRARLSKWVRGARIGMRKCATKKRGLHEPEQEMQA
ncbi:hypothetical protein F4777DRAFT_514760 [Nemania sp. FL0916]|nr:hypothetical protein F4777DRAFT_514760 [Nemania sp. FL0916]